MTQIEREEMYWEKERLHDEAWKLINKSKKSKSAERRDAFFAEARLILSKAGSIEREMILLGF